MHTIRLRPTDHSRTEPSSPPVANTSASDGCVASALASPCHTPPATAAE